MRTHRPLIAATLAITMSLSSVTAAHAEQRDFLFPSLDQLSSGLSTGFSTVIGNDPDSEENRAARHERRLADRRRETILHYGVTTQEQLDACIAENDGKPQPAILLPYDTPCPGAPITPEDVERAQSEKTRGQILRAPLAAVFFVFSILKLPFDWVWNGLRGERENFFASS